MKRILFAVLCIACTGTAWAQSSLPAQPQLTVLPAQQGTTVQQVSGGRIFGSSACAPACAPKCAPACTPTCVPACLATKTICVPEPAVKVVIKVNYSSVCEKVCFPKCASFFSAKSCDSGCAQPNCDSNIYQKKYLIKKVCVTECPTTKCVPVEVPVCETRGGIIHRSGVGAAPVIVESIPVAPIKK